MNASNTIRCRKCGENVLVEQMIWLNGVTGVYERKTLLKGSDYAIVLFYVEWPRVDRFHN